MAVIVVDGFNVIGLDEGRREAGRERFIRLLVGYRAHMGHEVTVVFDGWREGPGAETRTVTGGVAVVYSGLGERADQVIERLIAAAPSQSIVVTADRELQGAIWAAGSVPIEPEDFLRALERTGRGSSEETPGVKDDGDKAEEDEPGRGHGGNPKKLSKKQRALNRALAKL